MVSRFHIRSNNFTITIHFFEKVKAKERSNKKYTYKKVIWGTYNISSIIYTRNFKKLPKQSQVVSYCYTTINSKKKIYIKKDWKSKIKEVFEGKITV